MANVAFDWNSSWHFQLQTFPTSQRLPFWVVVCTDNWRRYLVSNICCVLCILDQIPRAGCVWWRRTPQHIAAVSYSYPFTNRVPVKASQRSSPWFNCDVMIGLQVKCDSFQTRVIIAHAARIFANILQSCVTMDRLWPMQWSPVSSMYDLGVEDSVWKQGKRSYDDNIYHIWHLTTCVLTPALAMYYRPEYCDDGDACRVICIVRPIAVCAALNSDSMENTSFKPEPCIFASIF